jgi:outer membrane beta-barrel protein
MSISHHAIALFALIAIPALPAAAQDSATADSDLAQEGQADAAGADEGGTGRTLQERIRAVSRRVFLKRQRFEIEPQFGFTTNDALNRAWLFGGRGSYHFNEEFAIDFGGGGGFNQALEDIRVIGEIDELPAGVKQLGYADIGITFSPFYGKLALMAEQVIHFDGFISAGLGVIVDDSPEVVHPAVELGVGGRVFLTKWLTLRGDLRNYAYPLTVGSELTFPNALLLSFGIGIHLPFDFDYSTEIIGGKG